MKFNREAAALMARTLKEYASLIESADPKNDEDFTTVIHHSVEICGIGVLRFVEEFGVSTGTISRWVRGKSIPHPMARPRILEWVKERVLERSEEFERGAEDCAPE